MARTINHDIGETVLLVAKVSAINVTSDDEVIYRVRIDGLGGDHWVPEADIFDEQKSEDCVNDTRRMD